MKRSKSSPIRTGSMEGDAEAVAEDGVGRAAAALAEDAARTGEPDDVPDGEEVARVVELLDEGQLLVDLPPDVLGRGAVPPPTSAVLDERAQQRHPGDPLPRGAARVRGDRRGGGGERGRPRLRGRGEDRRQRVLAADLVEPEPARIGDLRRRLEPFREVGPQLRHLLRSLQRPLGVREEPAPGAIDGGAEANAGEDVLQRLPPAVVRVHVVGDRHPDPEAAPDAPRCRDPRLVARDVVARDGQGGATPERLPHARRDVAVRAGVEGEQPASAGRDGVEGKIDGVAPWGRGGGPALRALRVRATGRIGQERRRARVRFRGHRRLRAGEGALAVRSGEDAAEVRVAFAVHREQHERRRARRTDDEIAARDLGAHHEREPVPRRLGVRTHDAVEPVDVGHRQRGQPDLGGALHQLLRMAGAPQEREGGLAAKLGVARGRHGGPQSKNPCSQRRPSRASRNTQHSPRPSRRARW
jgi:hypothetical protein